MRFVPKICSVEVSDLPEVSETGIPLRVGPSESEKFSIYFCNHDGFLNDSFGVIIGKGQVAVFYGNALKYEGGPNKGMLVGFRNESDPKIILWEGEFHRSYQATSFDESIFHKGSKLPGDYELTQIKMGSLKETITTCNGELTPDLLSYYLTPGRRYEGDRLHTPLATELPNVLAMNLKTILEPCTSPYLAQGLLLHLPEGVRAIKCTLEEQRLLNATDDMIQHSPPKHVYIKV